MLLSVDMGCVLWCWVMHATMLSMVGYVMGGEGAGSAACTRGDSIRDCLCVMSTKGVSVCGFYVQSCTVSWNFTLGKCIAVVFMGDVEIGGGVKVS